MGKKLELGLCTTSLNNIVGDLQAPERSWSQTFFAMARNHGFDTRVLL